ncbi:uncharacterized protein LOC129596596 [Paramacrobiotus metropolitanus]|uniref:uncharacterized protein LOC129596596 n=1 Tax=Paramacrobiotus metropolitanus TaxID=2943436 RepID=UPI00244620D8|nr:uncharacterized protein LOC129596596 [Paramacrobiotus metropolitanus]
MPTTRSQTALATVPSHSAMERFDPDNTDWGAWKQRFDNFVVLLDVQDDKKVNLLVESLERKAFESLYQVCYPQKIKEFTVEQLIYKLDRLYVKQTSKHYERSQFFRLTQQQGESLVEYSNRLRAKSINCEFTGTILDEMLLAAFLGGIQREKTRQHLYSREPTSIEGALADAQKFESRMEEKDERVMAVRGKGPKGVTCTGCGGRHLVKDCWYKNMPCNKCGVKGHLQRMCGGKSNYVYEEPDNVNEIVKYTDIFD